MKHTDLIFENSVILKNLFNIFESNTLDKIECFYYSNYTIRKTLMEYERKLHNFGENLKSYLIFINLNQLLIQSTIPI